MSNPYEGPVIRRRKSEGGEIEQTRINNGVEEKYEIKTETSTAPEISSKVVDLEQWKREREKELTAFQKKKILESDYNYTKKKSQEDLDELFKRKQAM